MKLTEVSHVFSLFHTEWCRKRCFFHCSIRNGAVNVVSFIAPYGMVP